LRWIAKIFRWIFLEILVSLRLWRRPATVSDLVFPAVVISPDNAWAFVASGPGELETFSRRSSRQPVEGSTIIDAEFNAYVQRNVQSKQPGEFVQIFRLLVPGERPVGYTFDLKRAGKIDFIAARERLMQCASYGGDDDEQQRQELARQSTLAGLIEVLQPPAVVSSEAEQKTP
jgi:hypothetical protein